MDTELEKPYTVGLDQDGCEKCGHGKLWAVVDPDGIALGTSYGEKDDAEDMADNMNLAFILGQAKERTGESFLPNGK